MIAHVASRGEDSGRVVLQLGSRSPSPVAMSAAIRIAQAFQSEVESLFVENEQLLDCTSFSFVREVSLTGRWLRTKSREEMAVGLRLAANCARRQVERLARQADVPLRSRVVRDEPLRAISVACAETGPWNVVVLAEPLSPGDSGFLKQLMLEIDGGERLQFSHLTLQEFFSAEALLHDPQGLLARFINDQDTWRETAKLWCGMSEDSTAVIKDLAEVESASP